MHTEIEICSFCCSVTVKQPRPTTYLLIRPFLINVVRSKVKSGVCPCPPYLQMGLQKTFISSVRLRLSGLFSQKMSFYSNREITRYRCYVPLCRIPNRTDFNWIGYLIESKWYYIPHIKAHRGRNSHSRLEVKLTDQRKYCWGGGDGGGGCMLAG